MIAERGLSVEKNPFSIVSAAGSPRLALTFLLNLVVRVVRASRCGGRLSMRGLGRLDLVRLDLDDRAVERSAGQHEGGLGGRLLQLSDGRSARGMGN